MILEQQVASLELCKKLKELGVKQDSLFWYFHEGGNRRYELKSEKEFLKDGVIKAFSYALSGLKNMDFFYPAFTVTELGEKLPRTLEFTENGYTEDVFLFCSKEDDRWSVSYMWYESRKIEFEADTEADARAKMLIYLLENKLVTL